MADAERTGTIKSIEEMESGPWKAIIVDGDKERSCRFWSTEYESDDESAVLEMLRVARGSGATVRLTGEVSERKRKDGKAYKQFMIRDVAIMSNGSALADEAAPAASNREMALRLFELGVRIARHMTPAGQEINLASAEMYASQAWEHVVALEAVLSKSKPGQGKTQSGGEEDWAEEDPGF